MYGIVPARSPIAVHSRSDDHMEIWVADESGSVRGAWWYGQWETWYTLGGATFPVRSWLAAVGRDDDHQEIWGIDDHGELRGRYWDGSWHDWYSLGAPVIASLPPGGPVLIPGAPLVAHSRDPGHMEVWVVANDGQLYGVHWNNGWRSWDPRPGRTFPPGAHLAVQGLNEHHMEIWAVGTDSKLHGIPWWNGSWDAWYTVTDDFSFEPGGAVAATGRNDDHMEVWSIDRRHTLKGAWWDGQKWTSHDYGGPTQVPVPRGLAPGAPLTALSRDEDYMDSGASEKTAGCTASGGTTVGITGTPLTQCHFRRARQWRQCHETTISKKSGVSHRTIPAASSRASRMCGGTGTGIPSSASSNDTRRPPIGVSPARPMDCVPHPRPLNGLCSLGRTGLAAGRRPEGRLRAHARVMGGLALEDDPTPSM
jgi:hypothetical protein